MQLSVWIVARFSYCISIQRELPEADPVGGKKGAGMEIKYLIGAAVAHKMFGQGIVEDAHDNYIEVQHPKDTAHTRRLIEMCPTVRFTGGNFRKGKAQSKLERLKTLLTGGKENCL